MEYKSLTDLQSIADVTPDVPELTRDQKIDIWVKALQRDPTRVLTPLPEIEWTPEAQRPLLRADDSPLTVAFEQPMLRAAGLHGDRLSDAIAFFGLTEAQAHETLCSCHYGRSMTAAAAARRISSATRPGLYQRVVGWFRAARPVAA